MVLVLGGNVMFVSVLAHHDYGVVVVMVEWSTEDLEGGFLVRCRGDRLCRCRSQIV